MTTKISDIDNKRIGHLIKFARDRKYLTADALAKSVDCARPTLSLYESGKRPVPKNRVPALALALGLDPALIDPAAA